MTSAKKSVSRRCNGLLMTTMSSAHRGPECPCALSQLLLGYICCIRPPGSGLAQARPLIIMRLLEALMSCFMHSSAFVQVSAGYDAHWRDPLAGLQLRTSTYHRLGLLVQKLAQEHAGDPPLPSA